MTPPSARRDRETPSRRRRLFSSVTRIEAVVAAAIAAVMVVLVIIEPNLLEAPFENGRTLLFTFGGTALAAVAFVAMLRFRVPAAVRMIVLVAPFALVNWWLISPYFVDEVVDETFATSISDQVVSSGDRPAATSAPETDSSRTSVVLPEGQPVDTASVPQESAVPETDSAPGATEPVLLGAGRFVGLAGHEGTGDAGIFQNPDGSLVLRFENFDIENGPDLEVYVVPGADQVSLPEGAIHLGPLKGNVGDQNYELPQGTELAPGDYTALVWCEAFGVEFVGATITV